MLYENLAQTKNAATC